MIDLNDQRNSEWHRQNSRRALASHRRAPRRDRGRARSTHLSNDRFDQCRTVDIDSQHLDRLQALWRNLVSCMESSAAEAEVMSAPPRLRMKARRTWGEVPEAPKVETARFVRPKRKWG